VNAAGLHRSEQASMHGARDDEATTPAGPVPDIPAGQVMRARMNARRRCRIAGSGWDTKEACGEDQVRRFQNWSRPYRAFKIKQACSLAEREEEEEKGK
jgi:hypothetical protein